MENLSIITNNVPRELLCGADLSDKEREEFDYFEDEEMLSKRFVRYRGIVYDVNEFQTTRGLPESHPFLSQRWDGFESDSFFSGIVVKVVDSESVIMGRFLG